MAYAKRNLFRYSILGLVAQMLLSLTLNACAADRDPYDVRARTAATPAGTISWPSGAPCLFSDAAGASLTLSDIAERALCRNPQTREAWANARYQAALAGASRAPFLPSVDLSATVARHVNSGGGTVGGSGGTLRYEQTSINLGLSYLLYDFGDRQATLDNAVQLLAAANAAQDTAVQTVLLSAVQAYYQFFAAKAALEAAQAAERSSLEGLNSTTERYRAGVAIPANKLQAQTAYSQAVLNRIRAEGDIKTALGVVANAIGLDANTPLNLASPPATEPNTQFEANVTALIEEARRRRPDLVAAQAQVEAAQAGARAADASGMPSLSLFFNTGYDHTSLADPSRDSAIGVTATIPLFSGYGPTYRAQAARRQVEVHEAQRDGLSQQVALDVWKAYQGLITETEALRSTNDLVASATQSERVALGRYQAGVGTIVELLTAQAALANALQQGVQEQYNWRIAKVNLAHAIGQLDFGILGSSPAAGMLH